MYLRFLKKFATIILLGFFLVLSLQACLSRNSVEDNRPDDNPSTEIVPAFKFYLPSILEETSGLLYSNGKCYSLNDSGGDQIIYRFDTVNGDIDQRITISNASNIDWEELAMDENYIYIGDFGNNNGNRTDLKIYRIDRKLIPANGDADISAEIIHFSYEDQLDFADSNNHNFDCEAMIAVNDSIYLFSKNRGDEHTKMYVLDNAPGTTLAKRRNEFDTDCLVTAADISPNGELVLIGYTNGDWIPVLWLFSNYTHTNFLQGNAKKYVFPNLISQIEGVTFISNDVVFISGEKTSAVTQKLFRLNTTDLKNAQ